MEINSSNLGRAFYAHSNQRIEGVTPAISLPYMGPVGKGESSYRPKSARTGPKLSLAAVVLQKLWDGEIVAFQSADADCTEIYVEYGAKKRKLVALSKVDGEITASSTVALTARDLVVPLTLLAVATYEETSVLANSLVAEHPRGSAESVLHFCDSVYFGLLREIPKSIQVNTVPEETLKAAVESNGSLMFGGRFAGESQFGLKTTCEPAKTHTVTHVDFTQCTDGEFLVPYNWGEVNIPALNRLDGFIPSPAFYSMVRKIRYRVGRVLERLDAGEKGLSAISNDYCNMLMVGKPGTGKTTVAYALGAALGMPVYSIPLSKNTEEDTFEGMNKVVEGRIDFMPTDFLNAYKNGGIVLLEEINLADPAVVMGAIGQAIEPPFVLFEDGHKKVQRHPLCVIIGTMNVGTYGSRDLNQALSSRFKQTFVLDDPTKEDFVDILQKVTGASPGRSAWVYEAYQRVGQYLSSPSVSAEDIALKVSMRQCIGALECLEEGELPMRALESTIIGKIAESDLELSAEVAKTLDALPPCPII